MASAQGNIRTFIAPPKGPGRTAPAFATDLTIYDPIHPPSAPINLLRDPPLTEAGIPELAIILPADSCRHEFCTKDRQSEPPDLDARPDENTIWTLAVMCRRCRLHAELRIDYRMRWEPGPCPNQENPLHHFVHSPWREDLARNQWRSQNIGSPDEIYSFECSSHTCSATVYVRLSPPIIDANAARTLTDEAALKKRTAEAFQRWPVALEGFGQPSVFDVVFDLRKYLRNAWDSSMEGKRIGLDNKRFVVRFGPEGLPCKEVLEAAGFIFEGRLLLQSKKILLSTDTLTITKPGDGWEPPRADPDDAPPFSSSQNILLDNLEHELTAIIAQLAQSERRAAQDSTVLRDATKDIARLLSCQNFDKDPRSRNIAPTRAPCYVALGIDPTASDANVIFAYKRQVATDPTRTAWYLSYLGQIARVRQSEEIEFEIVLQKSQNRYDLEQVHDAYRYFGFQTESADDEHIIGTYRSRLSDAPRQDAEMREQLRIIGEHRRSAKIKETAKGTLETYEQALTFLGAEISTQDDYIHSLYTTKVSEEPSCEVQARKAVELIARKRNNKVLLEFVKTGRMGDMEMDVGEAWRLFNIEDRTIEDTFLLDAYDVAISDSPGNAEELGRALKAIANDRQSSLLRHAAPGGEIDKASSDRPVGLENIGNTCYLNSLLQYFFTVSELRKIVLEFDEYKQELEDVQLRTKQVGRLKVKTQQVETAQKFVANLASLFREMITSPDRSVTPKQELARLTLESKSALEKVRRRSTIASGGRPSLGHIDNLPVLGPLGPPNTVNGILEEEALQTESPVHTTANPFTDPEAHYVGEFKNPIDKTTPSSEDADMVDINDNSSSVTLISNVSKSDSNGGANATRIEQQDMIDNKENLLPSTAGEGIRRSASPEKQLHPLAEASESDINSQAGALAPPAEVLTDLPSKPLPDIPRKPPPVPPRPQAKQKQESEKAVIEDYAHQQDVTEVIGHCLYQFSLAIRPLAYDQDGEQLDEIHNLFYGKQVTKLVPEDSNRNKHELFSNILTRVGSKPTDIYAALDGYFDVEEIEGAKRYISIVNLPPILAIQLDRVEYDKQTHRQKKNNGHVQLMETIYLDRYLDETVDSALMERRQQTWAMKKDLARMLTRKEELKVDEDQDASEILTDAQLILETLQQQFPLDEGEEPLGINDKTIETIGALAAHAKHEITDLKGSTANLNQNILSNFTDMRKHAYRLHAAFFHRGTPGFGHYWIYIYDNKKEVWRKYNDEYVSEVTDTKEIFVRPPEAEPGYKGGNVPPNPYFLVYVRDDEKDKLVETVHRNIIERPPPPPLRNQMSEVPPDVEMTDHVVGSGSTVPAKRFLVDGDDEDDMEMLQPLLSEH